MNINGEYIFATFKEVYEYIGDSLTNYERVHNIKNTARELVIDTETFKVVHYLKSDGTTTFIWFFKNSISREIWKFWTPNIQQLAVLGPALELGRRVDLENKRIKERWNYE